MRFHQIAVLVAATSGAAVPAARAQAPAAPDTFRLVEALRVAAEANPMLSAARSSAAAAAQRVGPAGALPDPQLQLGLMNRMAAEFGSTTDPMTMNQVQLMQMLPWPGKLSSARSAARHAARAAGADAEEQARMLTAQVRMAYYDVAYADRALDVMQRTQGLLRQFLDVSTTMYAVGSAVQQDVLRAQVEVARMAEEITRMEQDRVAGVARLNALLGREAGSAVGALELPAPAGELPEADSLIARARDRRPALRAGAERVAAAEASLSAARRELIPDLQLGFAYQARPAFPNMLSLMVGLNLPIFAGPKQLAMRREMAAMRDMSQAELANLRNETAARIIETRARAVRDRNLARLYRTSILPQARAAVQASLASYRVGRVSFMQLLDNQMTVNRYETEAHRLLADYHQAVGELAALTGADL
ncbi:MAG TPA: TolC family protein [Gemmatimonadales bacterium]|nr:TolC family protein [Gemmatimonadales bacterium]HYT84700.1 TolC family protein [Gemmatimonadales bacterium]